MALIGVGFRGSGFVWSAGATFPAGRTPRRFPAHNRCRPSMQRKQQSECAAQRVPVSAGGLSGPGHVVGDFLASPEIAEARSRPRRGTGLELAILKEIVGRARPSALCGSRFF